MSRYQDVLAHVSELAKQAGQHRVHVLPMTKGRTLEDAVACGIPLRDVELGESYRREIEAKHQREPTLRFVHVGPLQSGDMRALITAGACLGTVATEKHVRRLDAICTEEGAALGWRIQVRHPDDARPNGFRTVEGFMASVSHYPALRRACRGIVFLAPQSEDVAVRASYFRWARRFFEEARDRMGADVPGFDVCSMGMSGDYDEAIRYGATEVRLGSVLFDVSPLR